MSRSAARLKTEPREAVRSSRDLAAALGPALVALVLYLAMVPAASGDKDGSEFTLVLALGGVPHPTGYPVYSMLGHLFVLGLHALGAGWAWAANAWSAVGGAVAVLFLHALALRLARTGTSLAPRPRALLALIPTALFALNPIWTYEAVLAEVYSWHVAWVAAASCLFAILLEDIQRDGPWERRRGLGRAVGWGLLCGLGGAHHTTALFVAAPLSLGLLWAGARRGRAGAGEAVAVLAGALLPLAAYAFVAWRAFHPAPWQWPMLAPSWAGIWEHLSAAQYRRYLGHFDPSPDNRALLLRYVYPFLLPALGLLAVGTFRARAKRALFVPLAAAALLSTLYAFSYGVPDPASYFLAPMALAGCGAFGSLLAAGLGARLLQRRARAAAVVAGLATAALAVAWIDTGIRRRAVFPAFDRRVHGMWESIPFDRAIVLWASDMNTRLVEYQLLRGEKPGLAVENPLALGDDHARARFRARHGFDPLEGVSLPRPRGPRPTQGEQAELAEAMARALNARSPLPVILFDPQTESVRMLRKP